jgi:hypothetical protein
VTGDIVMGLAGLVLAVLFVVGALRIKRGGL